MISQVCLACGRMLCCKTPYPADNCPDPYRRRKIGLKVFNLSYTARMLSNYNIEPNAFAQIMANIMIGEVESKEPYYKFLRFRDTRIIHLVRERKKKRLIE